MHGDGVKFSDDVQINPTGSTADANGLWRYTKADVLRAESVRFVFHAQMILHRQPPKPPLTLEECHSVRAEVCWKGDPLCEVDWTSGEPLEALKVILARQGKETHGPDGPLRPIY